MSMFRRPGEDSSSDDTDSHEEGEKPRLTNGSSSENLSPLSRVRTVDSAESGLQLSSANRPSMSRNNSHINNVVLHAMLEKQTLQEAAKHLNKDVDDPEVRAMAQSAYQSLARHLPGGDGERYSSEDMKSQRAAAQDHLEEAMRSQFSALGGIDAPGSTRALMPHNDSLSTQAGLHTIFTSLPAPVSAPLQIPHQSYAQLGLRTDRYVQEFVELGIVGKGGYGKVYKVQHKLDNSLYAVKQIMVSPARLQKIQENGPQEMDTLLEEVRALAGFDHHNIVRYFNCWLEFSTTPIDSSAPATKLLRRDRLLEDVTHSGDQADDFQINLESPSFGDAFHESDLHSGADIVFESSEPGAEIDDSHLDPSSISLSSDSRFTSRRNRRASQASQATIATISSTRSHMSAIASVEDEDDVEMIQRSHLPHNHELTSDLSHSFLSHSDASNHMVASRPAGPVLTLYVQMSLYDTNLADFLSLEAASLQSNQLCHCFHPCISLELLSSIVSGVEYLHENNVVHRDLKPANIFLALSTSRNPPAGSINLSSCGSCSGRDSIHVTPRIGDFGLVAALGDKCMTSDTSSARPVGTELYRPEHSGKISEKLDVFALGVVAFEMLQQFSTKMERYDTLSRLRRSLFPDGFADSIQNSNNDPDCGTRVQDLLTRMVHPDEDQRWGCEEVKCEARVLIDILKR